MPDTGETPRIIAERYAVERVLGRGATATVYLARDRQSDTLVAVKVLLPEIAHGIGVQRFLREIRLTSRFNHPNVVSIQDSGVSDDLPFFVMPFMEGGSLRERLVRESQLPLPEAARITRDVAEALAHAHEQGLIHRDVKPENILFSGDRAFVSDFGIARAIAGSETISGTTPGVIRGTPAYMSPEQASGEADLDARTDVYSLACVAYEMIAGLPPFVGPNARNVMAQRMTRDALAVQIYRASAPPAVSEVMKRAMAVDRADRESDPREFARQLTASLAAKTTHSESIPGAPLRRRTRTRVWIGGAALVVGVAALASTPSVRRTFVDADLDSLWIAVGSVSAAGPETTQSRVDDATRAVSAAASWSDVRATTLDPPNKRDASAARSALIAEAKRSHSRWLVELQSQVMRDRLSLDATLVDASTGREVKRARVSVLADSVATPGAYGGLVANLFGGENSDSPGSNSSIPFTAWRAYVQGRSEMQRWRLDSAEQSLGRALRLSPSLDAAALRLGEIAVWHRQPLAATSRTTIIRALQRPGALSQRDSLIARGELAMDADDPVAACVAYDEMRRLDSLDVVAWLGLGDCTTRDHAVVHDSRSPSRVRFRSSYQAGIDAYLRAAKIDPASSKLFCPLSGSGVLITSPTRILLGHGLGQDTSRYAAYPSFDPRADTVVAVPYPFGTLLSSAVPQLRVHEDNATNRLISRHLALLIRLAESWIGVAPNDPDAHEALGAALELHGDILPATTEASSAPMALMTARRLASDERQQLRLAVGIVRLDVKSGSFPAAYSRADSLLKTANARIIGGSADPADDYIYASLAALIGRADALERWLIGSGTEASFADPLTNALPPQVRREIAALTAAVTLGQCDSITDRLQRSQDAIDKFVAPTARGAIWATTMPRLLSLATPCDRGRAVLRVTKPKDRLIVMQQSFARGDFPGTRAQLDTLERFRGAARPGDIALDYTVQEAWLLAQIGDSARALARVRHTLDALPTLGRDLLNVAEQAAAVCEALGLGSTLAVRLGDRSLSATWDRDRKELCPIRL